MSKLKKLSHANWSQTRYSWTVAIAIILAMVLMELIFSLTKNYESLAWRMLNLFFLLGAFCWMVYDYSKSRNYPVDYLEAFELCLKTGVRFCLVFFPLLLLALGLDHTDLHRIQVHSIFQSQKEPSEIFGALLIEVPVFIVIASIASAPMVGFRKNNSCNYSSLS